MATKRSVEGVEMIVQAWNAIYPLDFTRIIFDMAKNSVSESGIYQISGTL